MSATDTRARIEPMLDRFGITRVADITGLDEIGIPVHVAYRPTGRTLAVSIGIGHESVSAWVSAVMESIEVWHGENVDLPVLRGRTARSLDLPYDVRHLTLAPYSPLGADTPVDWVIGRGLLSDREVPIPLGVVTLDFTARDSWDHVLFQASSNGLATGNTLREATVHALLELIERDCCGPFGATPAAQRRPVDPDSCPHPLAVATVRALRASGCWIEAFDTTNELGVPAFATSIWHPDLPLYFTGFGCDPDPGRALARGLLEATLSRLATISGARDDIDEAFYSTAAHPAATSGPPPAAETPRRISAVVARRHDIDQSVLDCAARIATVTGNEPIALDLTHPAIGVAAVKVVAPGLATFDERTIAQRPGG